MMDGWKDGNIPWLVAYGSWPTPIANRYSLIAKTNDTAR